MVGPCPFVLRSTSLFVVLPSTFMLLASIIPLAEFHGTTLPLFGAKYQLAALLA